VSLLDEEIGQLEEGKVVNPLRFSDSFIDASQHEESLNQVSDAIGLPADTQVGFIVKALFLQIQPELAIGLALLANNLFLLIGQCLTNPLHDRLPFQRRRVSHELLHCVFSEPMAVVGMQVTPSDQAEFQRFLGRLGYAYVEETANPAYRMFLGR